MPACSASSELPVPGKWVGWRFCWHAHHTSNQEAQGRRPRRGLCGGRAGTTVARCSTILTFQDINRVSAITVQRLGVQLLGCSAVGAACKAPCISVPGQRRRRAYHHPRQAASHDCCRCHKPYSAFVSRPKPPQHQAQSRPSQYAGLAAPPLRPAGRARAAAASEQQQAGVLQATGHGQRQPGPRGRARAPAAQRPAQAHSSDRYRRPDVGRRADRWRPGAAGDAGRRRAVAPCLHACSASLTPPSAPAPPSHLGAGIRNGGGGRRGRWSSDIPGAGRRSPDHRRRRACGAGCG